MRKLTMSSGLPTLSIAVVGAGIAGLGAALALTRQGHRVTLFEAQAQLGGHAHTVDLELDGARFPVDTGFLVFNHRTYPLLRALFDELQVPTVLSDMSFSLSEGPHRLEWAGSSLRSLFAQPSNLLSPRFLKMLRDIVRFNRQATALASNPATAESWSLPLGLFLEREGYGEGFRDQYLLPMAAAIWSCPIAQMAEFPIGSFVRFFHNHGLLQIYNRPPWYTVAGGSREYVRRIQARLADVRLAAPVDRVIRRHESNRQWIEISSKGVTEHFDHVVLASHSDQSLKMLADASDGEHALLAGVRYQSNRAWLHTDTTLMPRRQVTWSAWNYMSTGNPDDPQVSVTYWLNRLQPLPCTSPVLLSLNPLHEPDPARTLRSFSYEHPILNQASADAVSLLPQLQGQRNTWFAGAWLGFGFHEDGLRSGIAAAQGLHEVWASSRHLPAPGYTRTPQVEPALRRAA